MKAKLLTRNIKRRGRYRQLYWRIRYHYRYVSKTLRLAMGYND